VNEKVNTALIDKIIVFAHADEDIRAVILVNGRQRMNASE
jgi:hypothetical protein